VTSALPSIPLRHALAVLGVAGALLVASPRDEAAAQAPDPTAVTEPGTAAPDTAAPVTAPDGSVVDRRVFVLGDSVILGAQAQIEATLGAAGWEVLFDATVGRSTRGGLEEILRRRTEVGGTVVVMLGHNDGADPQIFGPDADALLSELSDVPSVVWLTIHEVKDYYAQANHLLAVVAAGRANVQLVDWDAVADTPGVTNPDGLHLTATGSQAMADLVLAAIEGRAPAFTTTSSSSTSVAGISETAPTTTMPATTGPPATPASTDAVAAPAADRGGGAGTGGTLVLAAAGVAAVSGLLVRRRQLAQARDAALGRAS
jgi:lysophospholipase L1-like esterase